ncbi:MAG: hypothetical protein QM680_13395 [Luteolibacter sp.]
MGFNDPFQAIIISPLADLGVEVLQETPEEPETGWDSLKQRIFYRNDAYGTNALTAIRNSSLNSRGSAPFPASGNYANLRVTDRACRCLAPGFFVFDTVAKGIITPRGYKISYDSQSQTQTKDNVNTPIGLVASLETRETAVTATFEYLLSGTPPTNLVGGSATPPVSPSIRASIWGTVVDPTIRYPSGWVLDRLSAEGLVGVTDLWLIKATYAYIYQVAP